MTNSILMFHKYWGCIFCKFFSFCENDFLILFRNVSLSHLVNSMLKNFSGKNVRKIHTLSSFVGTHIQFTAFSTVNLERSKTSLDLLENVVKNSQIFWEAWFCSILTNPLFLVKFYMQWIKEQQVYNVQKNGAKFLFCFSKNSA